MGTENQRNKCCHTVTNKLFTLMALARALEADLKAEKEKHPTLDSALLEYPQQLMNAAESLISELGE